VSESPGWFKKALATPYEDRTVEVEGCPIHYLMWGETGRAGLVLVHGGAAHAHWWSFIAPLLIPEFQVVALDLSGHGESGRRKTYPRELWAQELLAVADDAGFDGPPIAIGHSMGGFVCIAAATERDRLAGAVILDSPVTRPDPEAEEGARGRSFRNPKVYPDEKTAFEHYRLVPGQPCENDFIIDHIAHHSLRQVAGGWTWKFDPAVFLRATPRAAHELLPHVRCRIALFRAAHGLVTPDIGEYMYELLDRNAPVIEVPESHHHLMLDQPLALVTGLRTLLADWEHSVPTRRSMSLPEQPE
jgi:pimeloyl-ACP methyl ester carboxylesterase